MKDAQYRIIKLKRDHPEISQRLMYGKFKSVSEAERTAKLTVYFLDSQAILARLISLM